MADIENGQEVDDIVISPARDIKIDIESRTDSIEAQNETGDKAQETQFEVFAPYWLNGLHNSQGIALAIQVNKDIKKNGLEDDRDAVAKLLAIYPNGKRYGLIVEPKDYFLNEPHYKINAAEPRSLMNDMFVRDKEGAYRPAAGGRAVLVDNGDSVVLKHKSADGYRAAMELAAAKGWTAIELKGKPAMLAGAWLEAKMMGLDVVNYVPTKEDQAKYVERIAAERAASASLLKHPDEVGLEQVEMRSYVDADGVNKVATVTYTVSHQGGEDVDYSNPKDAARAFSGIDDAVQPAVVRSVVRADGIVSADIIAVSDFVPGSNGAKRGKYMIGVLDQEFNEAFSEVEAEAHVQDDLKPEFKGVVSGKYSGEILDVSDTQVMQKVGRNPVDFVMHDKAKLSKVPKKGEYEDIHYSNGRGEVKERAREREGERELSR